MSFQIRCLYRLPEELYKNVISYIQPNNDTQHQYQLCLSLINTSTHFEDGVFLKDKKGNSIRKGFLYTSRLGDVRQPNELHQECIVLVLYVSQKFSRHHGVTFWRDKFFNYVIYQKPESSSPLGEWSNGLENGQNGLFITVGDLLPLRKNSKILTDPSLHYGDILSSVSEFISNYDC